MTEKEINYLINEFMQIDIKFTEVEKRLDNLSKRRTINISNEVIIYILYGAITLLILIITFNKIGG